MPERIKREKERKRNWGGVEIISEGDNDPSTRLVLNCGFPFDDDGVRPGTA